MERGLNDRMSKIENDTNKLFKIVFERLDDYEVMVTPFFPQNRKKIGLKK